MKHFREDPEAEKTDLEDIEMYLYIIDRSSWRGDCLEWLRCTNRNGYGKFRRHGKDYYAHRAMYEAMKGPINDTSLHVRHKCDNPLCVNPRHLEIGTNMDNVRDKIERGRQPVGEQLSELTEAQVIEMREDRAAGATISELEAKFGVKRSQVSRICRGEHWTHVGGPVTQRTLASEDEVKAILALHKTEPHLFPTAIAKKTGSTRQIVRSVLSGKHPLLTKISQQ